MTTVDVLKSLQADTVPAGTGEGEFPVSFAQQRLWFLNHLHPGNCAYNLGASHTIEGAVDTRALETAINDVVRRHGALRTAFREHGGTILQVVQPFRPLPLGRIDLVALRPETRQQELARIRHEEAAAPFDLALGHLIRATLVAVEPTRYELLVTMHHIVSDNWSLGIFCEELREHYRARSQGSETSLAPLAIQYGAYAAKERARLQGAELQRLVGDWAQRLQGAPPTVALLTDRPRPPQQTYNGNAIGFALTPELSRALHALARREHATLYMTLLAVFNTLLYRYSAQTDIVIGTPVANREASQLEQVIGLFVSTLPIRSRIDPDASFSSLVAQSREAVLQAQAGQDLPFEKLVEALRPERTLSRSPVFQIVFALQSTPLAAQFEVSTVGSMFDLSLFMWDGPAGVRGVFEYNTDLFDTATVARMKDHFVTLCSAAVADPGCSVARLPMLAGSERRRILEEWSGKQVDYPRHSSIAEVFEEVAARWPDAVALEAADPGGEPYPVGRLTYRELSLAATTLAARLGALGVAPGMPIAMALDRSIAAVVTMLAILKAGAVYVPLFADTPRERVLEMLRTASVRMVLTTTASLPKFAQLDLSVLSLEAEWRRETAPDAPSIAARSGPHDTARSGPHDVARSGPHDAAYVMFTSGTTGKPKGVCVTHRNVLRLACSADYVDLGPQETLLQFAPLSFDASTFEIWGALLNGARLVIFPQRLPSARELADVLDAHRITTLWLTAGFFNYMVENECGALARVRQVLTGGDVLSVTHVQKLLNAKHAAPIDARHGFQAARRLRALIRIANGSTKPV